jgi:hypothetical protein
MMRNAAFGAAIVAALALVGSPATAKTRWHAIGVSVAGPYTDGVVVGSTTWLTRASLAGFITVSAGGRSRVFTTRGFTPAYLTLGQDGRVWATDTQHAHEVGAITTAGQLTVYPQRARDRIPASRIRALGNFGLTYVGAANAVMQGWSGEFGSTAYPSGLTANRDIASALRNDNDVYVTECCLASGGAIADLVVEQGLVEYPLPYPECSTPAGMTYDLATDSIYVVCAGPSDTLLAAYDRASGVTTAIPMPGRYRSRVNSMIVDLSGNLYFANGVATALLEYQPRHGTFSRIDTPDGSVPRALEAGYGGRLLVITNDEHRVYEFDS